MFMLEWLGRKILSELSRRIREDVRALVLREIVQ